MGCHCAPWSSVAERGREELLAVSRVLYTVCSRPKDIINLELNTPRPSASVIRARCSPPTDGRSSVLQCVRLVRASGGDVDRLEHRAVAWIPLTQSFLRGATLAGPSKILIDSSRLLAPRQTAGVRSFLPSLRTADS